MTKTIGRAAALAALLGTAGAVPGGAADLNLIGIVLNTCILAPPVPGLLQATADGATLSSEAVLGSPSTMAIIATGTAPTIAFTAPAVTGPTLSGATTVEMKAHRLLGGGGSWTSSSSTYAAGRLIDTVAVQARITNANGFPTGTYGVETTATCQQ